jgi:hypothetical protein
MTSPVDLKWFEFIHRLGHQTSEALYQLTIDERKDSQRARDRMASLRHESNSAYGGRTLHYPLKQDYTRRPDRNYSVYGLTPVAIKVLKEEGLYREGAPTTNNSQWKHDFFGASVATSFYFAAKELGYRFIFQDEIDVPREYDVTYLHKDKSRTIKLRPDGFMGIEYPNGEVRLFIREEDCNTETLVSDRPDVKSHKHTMLAYLSLIGQGENRRKHFPGFPRVAVLTTFNSAIRMQSAIELLEELTGGKGSNFMLFKAWEAFGPRFRPPAPEPRLLIDPWLRAGQSPLDLTVL